ncbi:uncharacterized protein LOC134722695 [Mytilus trossulus]|uniref:uncharacterized protein LOC134722695 n=1 Tax=Mytilus trossulus TaxID=6551 RepID=UPI003004D95D
MMGFKLPLIMMVTAGVVLTQYADKLPRCLYPCAWRENIPLLFELDGIWILNNPSSGFITNISRPIGDQTATSECIMRHGPFFLLRKQGNVYYCLKFLTISDTDWYFFVSKESDTLSFCELCDGSKFAGPFYASGKKS